MNIRFRFIERFDLIMDRSYGKFRGNVKIRSIRPADQERAQALVIQGLRDNFGEKFNESNRFPDLEEIVEWYPDDTFLVAESKGEVVATGALIREASDTGRIVRMSVDSPYRSRGIGTRMLAALKDAAVGRGYTRLVVETTSSWEYVARFYLNNDFEITGYRDEVGEVDFLLRLADR